FLSYLPASRSGRPCLWAGSICRKFDSTRLICYKEKYLGRERARFNAVQLPLSSASLKERFNEGKTLEAHTGAVQAEKGSLYLQSLFKSCWKIDRENLKVEQKCFVQPIEGGKDDTNTIEDIKEVSS